MLILNAVENGAVGLDIANEIRRQLIARKEFEEGELALTLLATIGAAMRLPSASVTPVAFPSAVSIAITSASVRISRPFERPYAPIACVMRPCLRE
jgi:hypothetical protein